MFQDAVKIITLLKGDYIMESMINRSFDNLAQRSIYYFLVTYPSFISISSDYADTDDQKAAYEFIKGVYDKLYDNPSLLGFKLEPDDSFGDWELQKSKPDLASAIRKVIKKVEEFIAVLWGASFYGQTEGNFLVVNKHDMEIKPSFLKQLAAFGVKSARNENEYILEFPFNVNGLKLLAEVSAQNVKSSTGSTQKLYLLFSRGVFDTTAPWTREVFGNMLDDRDPFDKLIDFLEQNGYKRIDNKEYNNQISLDYIKSYGKPDDELKWAWAERTHGGIEVVYEEIRKNQPLIAMRISYFREILMNNGKMNRRVKDFVISYAKKCDGCRYCVQTDKTGKKPLACVSIDEYRLCPMFAGFQYRWKSLDDNTVLGIIGMLKFIDEIFADRKC